MLKVHILVRRRSDMTTPLKPKRRHITRIIKQVRNT